ncbi:MAG: sodium:proton antiporter NhaD [Bacteroidales bacterium]
MWAILILLFVVCYVAISLEHNININKSAIALFLAVALWSIVMFFSTDIATLYNAEAFKEFLLKTPRLSSLGLKSQSTKFIVNKLLLFHLGSISETLFFLIGAMTVVELIDIHGGFYFITKHITTRKIRKLLWTIAFITFFLSALLDNLTTTIVMIMLIRKLIPYKDLRMWFAGVIIIAANAGGAWSPIGDITTIMLWVKGDITALPTITNLILPSLVSMVIPVAFISYFLRGIVETPPIHSEEGKYYEQLTTTDRKSILIIGVIGLMCVPVFKELTGLPPFMGIILVLSLVWIYTEIAYKKVKNIEEHKKNRVTRVITHIDMPTILFFLGILLAVAALQVSGVLNAAASYLDVHLHNAYLINGSIGILSSIVDNVPLVAGAAGMYPIMSPDAIAAAADPAYATMFAQDGNFWQLLAYCAGVGGSLLIIGSAAGVVVMGLEKIHFIWYMKRFSLIVLLGYLAGMVTFWLQTLIF